MGGDADSEATMQRLQDILVKMTQFQVLVRGGGIQFTSLALLAQKVQILLQDTLVKMTPFQVLVGGGAEHSVY